MARQANQLSLWAAKASRFTFWYFRLFVYADKITEIPRLLDTPKYLDNKTPSNFLEFRRINALANSLKVDWWKYKGLNMELLL